LLKPGEFRLRKQEKGEQEQEQEEGWVIYIKGAHPASPYT
jgi:hypothetical protein